MGESVNKGEANRKKIHMAGKKREWTGVTGGSTFGQKAVKRFFSIVNVRFGYFILVFVRRSISAG